MNKETETVNRCKGKNTVVRRFEGSWEGILRFTSLIQLILKDALNVSSTASNYPQSLAHIPNH